MRCGSKRRDIITLGGVKFRFGKLVWQDSFACQRAPIESVIRAARRREFPTIETYGYMAKVGSAIVVLTEMGNNGKAADATIVTLSPGVKFEPR